MQAEYLELSAKLQGNPSVVINNCDRNSTDNLNKEQIEQCISDMAGPALKQIDKRLADLEDFLAERLGYKNNNATF